MVKIVFFGTSAVALPVLKKLAEQKNIEIAAVITRPDRPAGRGLAHKASPISQAAQELGLKIFTPEKVKEILPELEAIRPDLITLAAYGKIIPKSALDLPKYGNLNVHPSLLPQFRGPSPVQSAILAGAAETGVTIIDMNEKMDEGNIVAEVSVRLTGTENATELNNVLWPIGAELLVKTIPDFVTGKITPREQDHSRATYTKLITREDYRLDESRDCASLLRQVRAFADSPGAYLLEDGKRVKIFKAKCENGKLVPLEVQYEGKKRITLKDRP